MSGAALTTRAVQENPPPADVRGLEQRLSAYLAPEQVARVRRAYEVGALAHEGSELSPPVTLRVLEATHRRVLWAMATFALGDGTIVAERFSWRRGVGWRDLGPTRAGCPAVPSEVRAVWRLGTCA